MENRFQVAKFSFKVQKSKMAQKSLGLHVLDSESVLSGPEGVQSLFRGLFGPYVTHGIHSPRELC